MLLARSFTLAVLALTPALGAGAVAPSSGAHDGASRNRVSPARGLPTSWDVASGRNVKWVVELGTEAYGGPTVAGDVVFAGTNNERPRDPSRAGDHGVVMAFRTSDGAFLWQVLHPKAESGAVNDWPLQGVCSTPTIAGDSLFYVANRGELVRLEAASGVLEWSLDLRRELGVYPTHMAASSPLVVGDLVFSHTSNGIDETGAVPAPAAPSFIAVDARSGRPVWSSAAPGAGLIEGQWSSPTYGVVGGQAQVIFPGGDGWLYAFAPANGELLWRFDGNTWLDAAAAAETRRRNAFVASAVLVDGRAYVGMGRDPEGGSGRGALWAIDASQRGDVTASAAVWLQADEQLGRTISTVAVADGLVYAADLNGFLHCLDAATGERLWVFDALSAIWGSPLVADGKVYIGDDDGDVAVLAAGRRLEVLSEIAMPGSVLSSPVAADGVLYLMTRRQLFALALAAAETDAGSGGSQ